MAVLLFVSARIERVVTIIAHAIRTKLSIGSVYEIFERGGVAARRAQAVVAIVDAVHGLELSVLQSLVAGSTDTIWAKLLVSNSVGLVGREDLLAAVAEGLGVTVEAHLFPVLFHPVIPYQWAIALAAHALWAVYLSTMQNERVIGSNVFLAITAIRAGLMPLRVQVHFVLIVLDQLAAP